MNTPPTEEELAALRAQRAHGGFRWTEASRCDICGDPAVERSGYVENILYCEKHLHLAYKR